MNRLQKAALLAQSLGDQALLGELIVDAAQVFTSIGEYRHASRFLERARGIAVEAGSAELKGEVYRGFGILYKARGNLTEAAVCFDRALERLEYSARHRSVVRVLLDLGEVYLREGRTAQAAHLFHRAANLPAGADPALTVRLHLNLGRLAYLAGDPDAALREYEAAARTAEGADRSFERELVALGLAGLHIEGGRLEEALQRLREALALSIVAFAREPIRGIERARFLAMGERLLELETAVNRAPPSRKLRREVEETVNLHNAHPLVLTGALPRYGAVSAVLAPRPTGPADAPGSPARTSEALPGGPPKS